MEYGNWLYKFGMHDAINILGLIVVSNHSLKYETILYINSGTISERFAKILMAMSEKLFKKTQYRSLTYIEEYKYDALSNLITNVLPIIKKRGNIPNNLKLWLKKNKSKNLTITLI